ncbi:MAG: hypothetical protein L6R36_006382 [Xanthoria steineri]|nr:MAG: hypothetical protein L6R36_006382 [Xanthoria steineri]
MLTLAAFTLTLGFFHLAVSAPVVEIQPQFELTCPSNPGWKDRGNYRPGFLPNDQLSWCRLNNLSCSAGGEFVEPTPPLPDNTCSDCQCERPKAQPPPSSAYVSA